MKKVKNSKSVILLSRVQKVLQDIFGYKKIKKKTKNKTSIDLWPRTTANANEVLKEFDSLSIVKKPKKARKAK